MSYIFRPLPGITLGIQTQRPLPKHQRENKVTDVLYCFLN